MYIGKKKVKYKSGVQIVPFCRDCNSQEIETIQTCKKCGSHNIGTPNLLDNDIRGEKQLYKDGEEPFYKCDYCGKEFSGFQTPNKLIISEGLFMVGYNYELSNYDYVYTLDKDLCEGCLNKIKNKLNNKYRQLFNSEYVKNTVNELLEGDMEDES